MEQTEGQAVAAVSGPESPPPHSDFSWQASEYVFHEKPAGWYLALWGIAVALCGVLVFFHQWPSIVVIVVMTLAVIVYSRKQPRVLDYRLDAEGISINGKLSYYGQFRSYSVQQDLGWQSIDLEPAKRFIPKLTLLSENENLQTIETILAAHLPRIDSPPDWIDRLSRYLKF